MIINNKQMYVSDFYCTSCGKRGLPIMRCKGKDRESGHLKNLYCIYCKKETNHAEVRPFGSYTRDDFREEFESGIFIDGKRREL